VTQSTPDVMKAVKQEAQQYLGDVSSMSDDQIRSRIRNLAKNQPDTARRMVDSVCSTLDRSTGGQFSGQIDRLEQLVFNKLGLEPGSLPTTSGPASNFPGGTQSRSRGGAQAESAGKRARNQAGSMRNRAEQALPDESPEAWSK
jgi:hypothetical protein